MAKTVWFDMDGTLYDLYNIPGWLELLQMEEPGIFRHGQPMYNPFFIRQAILALIAHGWQVGVITWAPKGVAEEEPFFIETKRAKQEWLRRHYPELLENFYCLPYGQSKAICACDHWKERSLDPDMGVQILVDDNMLVRDEWADGWETHFKAIDANSDYVKTLEGLVM